MSNKNNDEYSKTDYIFAAICLLIGIFAAICFLNSAVEFRYVDYLLG